MRFRVERRSGIVAVYDTEHPEYQDTPGCHADYPWTVCSWHGAFDEKAGHWNVDQRWDDKAHAACDLLNTLSANNTGERPETQNELFGSGMILTVILRDDSPMIHFGDSPAYRSVRVELTPEQVAAIAPRKTGCSGMQEEYESISKAFIEPDNKKGELK